MRKIQSFLVAALVAGCASQQVRAPIDADVSYEPWLTAEAIESVRFPTGAPLGNGLEFCIARVIRNKSVTLQDSSNSWTGPASGKYYHVEKSQESGGGDVLLHSGPSGTVAQGSVQFQSSAFVERSVRFTLTITEDQYEFTDLEQALLNSGAAANDGYNKIGAWSSAEPGLAVTSLKQVTTKLDRCLSQSNK